MRGGWEGKALLLLLFSSDWRTERWPWAWERREMCGWLACKKKNGTMEAGGKMDVLLA